MVMLCRNCNKEVDTGIQFCPHCGVKLSITMREPGEILVMRNKMKDLIGSLDMASNVKNFVFQTVDVVFAWVLGEISNDTFEAVFKNNFSDSPAE